MMKTIVVLFALGVAAAGCATSSNDLRPGGAASAAVPEPVSPADDVPVFMAALKRNRKRIKAARLELTRLEQNAEELRFYDKALNEERLLRP